MLIMYFGLHPDEYQKLEDCVRDHFNFSLKTLRTLQEDGFWEGKSTLEHVKEATPYYQSQPKYSSLFNDEDRGGEICESLVDSAIVGLEENRDFFRRRKRHFNRNRSRASKDPEKRTFKTPSCDSFRHILPRVAPEPKTNCDSTLRDDQNRQSRALRRLAPAPKQNLTTETYIVNGPVQYWLNHCDRTVPDELDFPVNHADESEDIPQIHLERDDSEDSTYQEEDRYEHSPCPSTHYHVASSSSTPARHRQFTRLSRYLQIGSGETEGHTDHTESCAGSPDTAYAQIGPHVYYRLQRPWQSDNGYSDMDDQPQLPHPSGDAFYRSDREQHYIEIRSNQTGPNMTIDDPLQGYQTQSETQKGYHSTQRNPNMEQKALPSFQELTKKLGLDPKSPDKCSEDQSTIL